MESQHSQTRTQGSDSQTHSADNSTDIWQELLLTLLFRVLSTSAAVQWEISWLLVFTPLLEYLLIRYLPSCLRFAGLRQKTIRFDHLKIYDCKKNMWASPAVCGVMASAKAVQELVCEVQHPHPQGNTWRPLRAQCDEQTVEVVHIRGGLGANIDSLLTDPARLLYISFPRQTQNLPREHLGKYNIHVCIHVSKWCQPCWRRGQPSSVDQTDI